MTQGHWRSVVSAGFALVLIWGLGCGGGAPEMDLRSPEVLLADRMWSRGGVEDARAALAEAAEIPSSRFAALYRLGILWMAEDPQIALGYFAMPPWSFRNTRGPSFSPEWSGTA